MYYNNFCLILLNTSLNKHLLRMICKLPEQNDLNDHQLKFFLLAPGFEAMTFESNLQQCPHLVFYFFLTVYGQDFNYPNPTWPFKLLNPQISQP